MPPKAKKTGGKIPKKRATLILQKLGRGWLVRHFYKKIIEMARSEKISTKELLWNYKRHLREIKSRHDEDTFLIGFHFLEIYDYLVKKKRYEGAFDDLADGNRLKYGKITTLFDNLNLKPTPVEIRLAAEKILGESSTTYQVHEYGKVDVLNIALHIYPPKGTYLANTRKSTWLCPVVDNDDVLRFGLSDKDAKKINLSKCIDVVSTATKNKKTGEDDMPLSDSKEFLRSIKAGSSSQKDGSKKSVKRQKK